MIFAMHQIQVACVVHHGLESAYFRGYLKELVQKQLLMASATTEVGIGGDLRSSICAVEVSAKELAIFKVKFLDAFINVPKRSTSPDFNAATPSRTRSFSEITWCARL